MWRDTREARLKRYREILAGSPLLYGAAEASGEGTVPGEGAGSPEKVGMPPVQHSGKKGKGNLTEKFADAIRQEERPAKNPENEENRKTFENVCDYVLAPALNGFVQWVLKEALDSGKKRLYFLARDGYLMYRAALVYCEKLNLPIECRYLSCSRYSIRIPMFHLDMDGAMDYICRGGIDVTMDKILNRAGLTEEEKGKVLKDLDLGFLEDGLLPYAILPKIRKELLKCDRFQTYLFRHSMEAMPGLEGYLTQEGLLDGTPSALVDSGWVGSMQKILNELLEYIRKKNQISGEAELEGYYWGLYELPAGVAPEKYHCYYFSPGGNLREKVYFSNCLFEGIFSAPHGMTLGYAREDTAAKGDGMCLAGHRKEGADPAGHRKEGADPAGHRKESADPAGHGKEGADPERYGKESADPERYGKKDAGYHPVYAEISDGQKKFMELTEVRLLDYTGKLAERLCEPEPDADQGKTAEKGYEKKDRHSDSQEVFDQIDFKHDCRIIGRLLELFMGEPTALEAEVYGRLHFSDDVLDYGGHQMAEPMSQEELTANHLWHKALAMLGVQKKHVKESAWYEGSAVRSGKNVKRHLRRYAGYKYLLYMRKKYQMRNLSGEAVIHTAERTK